MRNPHPTYNPHIQNVSSPQKEPCAFSQSIPIPHPEECVEFSDLPFCSGSWSKGGENRVAGVGRRHGCTNIVTVLVMAHRNCLSTLLQPLKATCLCWVLPFPSKGNHFEETSWEGRRVSLGAPLTRTLGLPSPPHPGGSRPAELPQSSTALSCCSEAPPHATALRVPSGALGCSGIKLTTNNTPEDSQEARMKKLGKGPCTRAAGTAPRLPSAVPLRGS